MLQQFSEFDQTIMRMALSLAKHAGSIAEVPVGCVITCENRIVGTGFNSRERHHSPIGHAEIMALQQASTTLSRWRLSDCSMYVTLEPCLMCAGALVQARIGRLIFATPDPKAGAVRSLYQIHQDERLNHRFPVASGLFANDAKQLLQDFLNAVEPDPNRAA